MPFVLNHFSFSHEEMTHEVYWQYGKTSTGEIAPAVLIMHELPGMTERCLEFAQRVVEAGFSVYLPLFCGKVDESSNLVNVGLNSILNTVRLCISQEFYLFKTGQSSPITNWLRALCRHIYDKPEHSQYKGIGAVGMCMTGGFVLSLLVDNSLMSPVVAPVMSQPALPFAISSNQKKDLGISESDLEKAKERAKNTDILALRFEEDIISPPERFRTLKEKFGDKKDGGTIIFYEICAADRKRDGIREKPHPIFTEDFADRNGNPHVSTQQALEQLLDFLRERLF